MDTGGENVQKLPQRKSIDDRCAAPTDFRKSVQETTKAYENKDFLHSRGARHIRIMCEYLETQVRLRNERVMFSVLFFGSAAGHSEEDWEVEVEMAERKLASTKVEDPEHKNIEARIAKLKKTKWLCEYYEKSVQLAAKITEWSTQREALRALNEIALSMPSPVAYESPESFSVPYPPSPLSSADNATVDESPLVVCSGGGPGLMEAANRGAYQCVGGRSMGMGISLPAEAGLNPYVTKSLAFQFHYFFTRKFWMMYLCLGLVAMPGGFGTLDELMETLTLKQTGKVKRNIPIVLFGSEFWKKTINFDHLVECGTIAPFTENEILYTDDVEEAFQFIRGAIIDKDRLIVKDHKSRMTR